MGIPSFLLFLERAIREHELQRARCWPSAIPRDFLLQLPQPSSVYHHCKIMQLALAQSRSTQLRGTDGAILSTRMRELVRFTITHKI